MKYHNKRVKGIPLVKRSDAITEEHLGTKGYRVQNGRGIVQIKPVSEMLGRKFGELVKTRTSARKRVTGNKSKVPMKPMTKKPTNKK